MGFHSLNPFSSGQVSFTPPSSAASSPSPRWTRSRSRRPGLPGQVPRPGSVAGQTERCTGRGPPRPPPPAPAGTRARRPPMGPPQSRTDDGSSQCDTIQKIKNEDGGSLLLPYLCCNIYIQSGAVYRLQGFEGNVFQSSSGWWAATAATYCPSRLVELPKTLPSKPCDR